MMLADVVVEGTQDDVLLAIHLAAGQDDFILAGHQQALGHQEGIGEDFQPLVDQELDHAVGGGAAIDDDGVAIGAQAAGVAGDGALLCGAAVQVVLKGFARQRKCALFFLRQALGAAAGAHQQATLGQPGDIAPHRRRRGIEPADQLVDARHAMFGE
ncbi:hypothetical protein D3C72_1202680 [compost metagenome]